MLHKDDSIPTNACTSVNDKAGVENVDGMQNPDDGDDDEAGDDKDVDGMQNLDDSKVNEAGDNEDEDHIENDEDKDCEITGGLVRLSVDLLYPSVFSVSVWTALLTLQCLLQHIQVLQVL